MNANGKTQGDAPLDILYAELIRTAGSDGGSSLLDICLHGTQREISAVPLRLRLIALGFVKGLSPEEVNRRLLENGCPRLYARSYWEASVIFALRKGLTYARWKEMLVQCGEQREEIVSNNRAFSDRTISLSDIRLYVKNNSLREADPSATLHVTKSLEDQLAASDPEHEEEGNSVQTEFRDFLLSNLASFSTVREKARYYFCKYLLYDLDGRKKACAEFAERETGAGRRDVTYLPSDSFLLRDLHVFKVLSRLRRKRHTEKEVNEIIESSALSLRMIYTLYSRFYFEYPFHDWIRILMENGTAPLTLDPNTGKTLADAARRDTVHRNVKKPKERSDAALLEWLQKEIQALEDDELSKKKISYQSGREGENFLRKVLRGTLDLDRTTLLSFLLYFGNTYVSEIPAAHRISRERLNVILEESGFPALNPSLPFDRFVCRFLESPDPQAFLIEEAEQMALSGKNFYLHRAWRLAESAENQWHKMT